MQNNYEISLKYVLLDEGGNDDDPQDHGGRTSRGITQREYDAWCSNHGKTTGDVWNASDEDVRAIYQAQYWQPYCDAFPAGLDYLFFDISVNCGRTRAVKQFQQALGVTPDGMMGQVTLSAVKGTSDTPSLIKRISDLRRTFYTHLKGFDHFGKGWMNRVNHSEQRALAIAGNIHHEPVPAPAERSQDQPNTPTLSPGATGTLGAGLLAVLNQFKEDLAGLSSYIPNINYILFGVAIVTVGYAFWSMYKNNQISKVF